MENFSALTTEKINPATVNIDKVSTFEMVKTTKIKKLRRLSKMFCPKSRKLSTLSQKVLIAAADCFT